MWVLCAVVAGGSVTAAAARLGYTPSAVSQQVAALERQTGTALLERVGRGVRPTAAGRLLAEHAVLIGRQIAEAEAALADLRAGRTGRLVVRYAPGSGAGLVAPAVALLRAGYPDVRVDLGPADDEAALAEVARGPADLAVVTRLPGPPDGVPDGVRLEHLMDDAYRAVLPAGHPLAARRVVDLDELAGEPWISSGEPGPDALRHARAAVTPGPDIVVTGEDQATVQSLVAAGLGIALTPLLGLGTRHPGVVVRRVRNPEPVRPVHAALRTAPGGHPALPFLLDALRDTAPRGTERRTARRPVERPRTAGPRIPRPAPAG
ncbi:LysR family transcriptional regulator [Streptomyces qinzhouensis]|uniref:LysR family transcriptional regulator n=1 Tax=Streptomyces qinzhouensis TaxID=2599401 RepID=A0A5B8ISN5_9ACTN|nr:LysR family transcriptional regulator [Streptomyces qinzhouensis]QDY80679.1 LysR family transcriptional regulator [Streptomyces qinzhouensis]